MAIRHFNPVTPGQRKKSTLVNEELTKTAPEKSLLKAKNKKSTAIVRHVFSGVYFKTVFTDIPPSVFLITTISITIIIPKWS